MVENKIINARFNSPWTALYAAGGIISSDGKGIKVLSIAIKMVMVK
jgi:hypothetical protein